MVGVAPACGPGGVGLGGVMPAGEPPAVPAGGGGGGIAPDVPPSGPNTRPQPAWGQAAA